MLMTVPACSVEPTVPVEQRLGYVINRDSSLDYESPTQPNDIVSYRLFGDFWLPTCNDDQNCRPGTHEYETAPPSTIARTL